MNVVLHALAHVVPFRDYLLRESNYSHIIPPPGDQTFILGKPGDHIFTGTFTLCEAFEHKINVPVNI